MENPMVGCIYRCADGNKRKVLYVSIWKRNPRESTVDYRYVNENGSLSAYIYTCSLNHWHEDHKPIKMEE